MVISNFQPSYLRASNLKRISSFFLVAVALAASDLIRLGSRYAPITPETIFARYAAVVAAVAFLCLLGRSAPAGGFAVTHLAWIGFGLAVTLSGCAQADVNSIGTGLWMMIAVPLVFGRMLPRVLGRQGIPLLIAALIAAGLGYILYSVVVYPLEFPYMGVTANPNSMGVIAAGATTGLIATLVSSLTLKKPWFRLVVILAAVATAALVIASGSRTSAVAVVAVAVVAGGACFPVLIRRPGRLLAAALVCAIGVL